MYKTNRVFVVPDERRLGTLILHVNNQPNCAAGHLCEFLGVAYRYGWRDKLCKKLNITDAQLTELTQTNDCAFAPAHRRQNFINWLRQHFPEQEVK